MTSSRKQLIRELRSLLHNLPTPCLPLEPHAIGFGRENPDDPNPVLAAQVGPIIVTIGHLKDIAYAQVAIDTLARQEYGDDAYQAALDGAQVTYSESRWESRTCHRCQDYKNALLDGRAPQLEKMVADATPGQKRSYAVDTLLHGWHTDGHPELKDQTT